MSRMSRICPQLPWGHQCSKRVSFTYPIQGYFAPEPKNKLREMASSFSCFPSGAAGAGLLLLRASVAYSLFLSAVFQNSSMWQQLIGGAAILAILMGMQVRVVSVVCVVLALGRVLGAYPVLVGLPDVFSASALALVGPGAFSIDARLFGRRVVVLADSSDVSDT